MKNTQKGGVLMIIIVIVLILLVIMGGLYFMTASSLKEARENNTPSVQTSTSNASTLKVPTGWKEYSDKNIGFSLAYPANWSVKVDSLGGITISAPTQDINTPSGNMVINSIWTLILGKVEQAKTIDPLNKYIEQNSNTKISGIKASKSVKSNSNNVYSTTINFVANNRYNSITEKWYAAGSTDALQANIKLDAIKVLAQITSTLVIK